MKSRGVKYGLGIAVFLMGLLLAAPGPAGADGITHAKQHGPFRRGFQQHRFGHLWHRHHPGFFRFHHKFLHHPRFFRHHHKFRHPGLFHHPHGFRGGRVIIRR